MEVKKILNFKKGGVNIGKGGVNIGT